MISPLNNGASRGGGSAPASNQAVALRVAVIGAVLLGLFAIVFFRLWYLQVLSGDSLAAAASKNRTRKVPVTAPRGDIVDRNGNKIVGNRRAQIIELAPASLPKIERNVALEYGKSLGDWQDDLEERYTTSRVAKWTKIPDFALRELPRPKIRALNDPELVKDYEESVDPQALPELRKRYERLAWLLQIRPEEVRQRVIKSLYLLPYGNIPLRKQGASESVVAYIAENSEQFPGVTTTPKFVRSYPFHEVGAQLFGQVGSVPVDEEGKPSIEKYRQLNTAAQVGLNGLERQYDGELRGKDGEVRATVDAFGNVQGEPVQVPPVAGDKLQLTLDRDLERRAQQSLALGSKFNPLGKPGAAVALDPRNGEVLALVSNPSFDPSDFVRGVSDAQFDKFIDENGGKPLFNRATDGGYPAASTFKPVTAFAALAAGVSDPSEVIRDNGKIKISTQEFKNAGSVPNGDVNLERAMQVSSDVYFYSMGARLNVGVGDEPLQQWARKLGFDKRTGIDLPSEFGGTIPDRAWRAELYKVEQKCRANAKPPIPQGPTFPVKLAAQRGCGNTDMRDWSLGDNVQLAIGQGDVQISPLQNAVLYAAIANGGKIVRPHLAKAQLDREGAVRQKFDFPIRRTVDLATRGGLAAVQRGLYLAANEPGGTSASVFAGWPRDIYPIYGKTGTAEREGQGEDQSWYACYVPDPKKPIVVVVTVERGGFGAQTAAPIAGQILKEWFDLPDVKIVAGDSATR